MTYAQAAQELEQIIGRSSINMLMAIKHTGIAEAAKLLRADAPGLSDEATTALLATAQQASAPFNKSKFYAVAWCLGATYSQLSKMFGVARATVVSSSRSYLTEDMRDELKANRSKHTSNITLSQLANIRSVYEDLMARDGVVMQQLSTPNAARRVQNILDSRADEYSDTMQDDDNMANDPMLPSEPLSNDTINSAFTNMFGQKP